MNEIKLSIDDANVDTVLSILNNLKDGLISDIVLNSTSKKIKATQYQAKVNTIIREENSGTNDRTGKYANPLAYKQRLKNKKS